MAALAGKPALDRGEGVGLDADEAPLPLDPALDEAGALQHLQMARHGRRADREGPSDVADRQLAPRHQALDDREPRGIGEGGEDGIERRHAGQPGFISRSC